MKLQPLRSSVLASASWWGAVCVGGCFLQGSGPFWIQTPFIVWAPPFFFLLNHRGNQGPSFQGDGLALTSLPRPRPPSPLPQAALASDRSILTLVLAECSSATGM